MGSEEPQHRSAVKTDRARILRLVTGSLVGVMAFLAAGLAMRQIFPFPEVPEVRAKWAQFKAHPNDYDTLFIGSSRINHQVIPAIFDRLTLEGGHATKTFNAGVAGMRPPEDFYFFEQLLAARPQRLRWVFIELNAIPSRMEETFRGSLRAQYWHDPLRFSLVWRRKAPRAQAGKKSSLERRWRQWREVIPELSEHVGLFAREMTNLGKGEFLARRLVVEPDDWRRYLPRHLGLDMAGWRPTGRGEELNPQNRANFEKEHAERLEKPAEHDASDAVSQEVLEGIISRVERLGATPVLVLAPRLGKKVFYPRPERAKRTLVLDFNDPVRFPELFENRHRLDWDHLNTAGSEIFTRLLALHWLAAAKGGEPTR